MANPLHASRLYADLMAEVKVRVSAINVIMADSGLQGFLVRECCYLQLRMVGELIALGCLVMHGDIEGTARLQKEWSAEKIIERLARLHPDFYPQPVSLNYLGSGKWNAESVKEEHLTRDELLKLLGQTCGDVLHRGSMKKLLSGGAPVQKDFADIPSWVMKVGKLLDWHTITHVDDRILYLIQMETMGGSVRVVKATHKGDLAA
jgi:hypothetical protein